jgi:hypothetical protein
MGMMSSSKSVISHTRSEKGGKPANKSFYDGASKTDESMRNPFSAPSDEKIFSFKEEEKENKLH